MKAHPGKTQFIKTGRSTDPFLLFLGNRKEDEFSKPLSSVFAVFLLAFVLLILGVCIVAFFSGKLG